jgi:hypothetical protein
MQEGFGFALINFCQRNKKKVHKILLKITPQGGCISTASVLLINGATPLFHQGTGRSTTTFPSLEKQILLSDVYGGIESFCFFSSELIKCRTAVLGNRQSNSVHLIKTVRYISSVLTSSYVLLAIVSSGYVSFPDFVEVRLDLHGCQFGYL